MLSRYLQPQQRGDVAPVATAVVAMADTEHRMIPSIESLIALFGDHVGSDRLVRHAVQNTLGLENLDFTIEPVKYSPTVRAHIGVFEAVKQCYDALKQAAEQSLSNKALAPQLDSDLGNTLVAVNLKRDSRLLTQEITYSALATQAFVGMQDHNHLEGVRDFIRARELVLHRAMAQMEAIVGRVNHLVRSISLEDSNSAEALRFARNKILAEFNVADVGRMLPAYVVVDDALVRSRLFAQCDAVAYGHALPAAAQNDFMTSFKQQIFDVCPKVGETPQSIKTTPMPATVMESYLTSVHSLLDSLQAESGKRRLLGIFHELDLAMGFCAQLISELKRAATANATIDENTFLVLREHMSMIAAFSTWASLVITGLESVTRLAIRSSLAVVKESLVAYK